MPLHHLYACACLLGGIGTLIDDNVFVNREALGNLLSGYNPETEKLYIGHIPRQEEKPTEVDYWYFNELCNIHGWQITSWSFKNKLVTLLLA